MDPIDPRVPASLLPENCKAVVVAEHQDQYDNLPSIVTPEGQVITRWRLTEDERRAIFYGEDVFATMLSHGQISPFFLSVGPTNWKERETKREDEDTA